MARPLCRLAAGACPNTTPPFASTSAVFLIPPPIGGGAEMVRGWPGRRSSPQSGLTLDDQRLRIKSGAYCNGLNTR